MIIRERNLEIQERRESKRTGKCLGRYNRLYLLLRSLKYDEWKQKLSIIRWRFQRTQMLNIWQPHYKEGKVKGPVWCWDFDITVEVKYAIWSIHTAIPEQPLKNLIQWDPVTQQMHWKRKVNVCATNIVSKEAQSDRTEKRRTNPQLFSVTDRISKIKTTRRTQSADLTWHA